jgi:iron-sulfur cluster assembly accessory protein
MEGNKVALAFLRVNSRRIEIMSATTAPTMVMELTETAAGEVKNFMSSEEGLPETAGLRVRVVPGGCSGFQYSLNIEEDSRDGDYVLSEYGVRLFVDMFSAQYLNGVKIDYVSGMMGSGFTFTNPNATGGCGCGSSFTA